MSSPRNRTITLSERERARRVLKLTKATKIDSRVYCGSIESALDLLPENSFDLIIADPPYNYGVDFGNDSDKRSDKEYRKWTQDWIAKLPRVASANASIYICCGWEYSALYQSALAKAGFAVLNRITWKRDKGRGA